MDKGLKRSEEKIIIMSEQKIDDMLNKFGPEGLYSLAEQLKARADKDVADGMLEGIRHSDTRDVCYHTCPYFGLEDGKIMVCNHTFFKDKPPYSNYIITQENSRNGQVPDECPLKK
jgi:hypothetical protein